MRSAGDAVDGGAERDADLRQLGERRLKCVDVGPSAPATHTRQRFLADLRAGVPVYNGLTQGNVLNHWGPSLEIVAGARGPPRWRRSHRHVGPDRAGTVRPIGRELATSIGGLTERGDEHGLDRVQPVLRLVEHDAGP
jgi:hypothetical protein